MLCIHCDREFQRSLAAKCGTHHGDEPLCPVCGLCQGVESTPAEKQQAKHNAQYFEDLMKKFPSLGKALS